MDIFRVLAMTKRRSQVPHPHTWQRSSIDQAEGQTGPIIETYPYRHHPQEQRSVLTRAPRPGLESSVRGSRGTSPCQQIFLESLSSWGWKGSRQHNRNSPAHFLTKAASEERRPGGSVQAAQPRWDRHPAGRVAPINHSLPPSTYQSCNFPRRSKVTWAPLLKALIRNISFPVAGVEKIFPAGVCIYLELLPHNIYKILNMH